MSDQTTIIDQIKAETNTPMADQEILEIIGIEERMYQTPMGAMIDTKEEYEAAGIARAISWDEDGYPLQGEVMQGILERITNPTKEQ